MKRVGILAVGFLLVFAGCSGDEDAVLDLTGIWDVTGVVNDQPFSFTLIQTGGAVTGTMGNLVPVNGMLNDNLATLTMQFGGQSMSFNGMVSGDGNGMTGA